MSEESKQDTDDKAKDSDYEVPSKNRPVKY